MYITSFNPPRVLTEILNDVSKKKAWKLRIIEKKILSIMELCGLEERESEKTFPALNSKVSKWLP